MLEKYLLYCSILGCVVIFILLILIIIKVQKDIKKMNQTSRKSIIKYIRKTSKYNKPKRKKLEF